jgi:NitT/TauT family transport system ATP-binding protein
MDIASGRRNKFRATNSMTIVASDAMLIQDLSVHFGELVALNHVNLQVRNREFVVILGPSGCGKSTLLSILGGLQRPTGGHVVMPEPTTTDNRRKPIGYVFQHASLLPWFSVMDNVTLGLRSMGYSRKHAESIGQDYLNKLNLIGFERNYPHTLSGGMQQRAGLARALAVDPDVLLMDEPFGALDAQTRAILQEELLRIWDTNKKTVVFVTHSIEEAVLMADRVVVMTARPGTIKAIVDIDLPRPRSRSEQGARFGILEDHLWQLVRDEAKKAFTL